MITCPRCNAPASALELRREPLARGSQRQTVRCLICGETRSRIATIGKTLGLPAKGRHYSKSRCAVLDCNQPLAGHNKSGMCTRHSKMLNNWKISKKTKPAPFIHLEGRWIENPERAEVTA